MHIARARKYYEERVSCTLRFTVWHLVALNHLMRISLKGQRILDAGCGHGALCKLIIDKLSSEYVVGLDISSNRVRVAKRYLGPRVELIIGDIHHLPFRPGAFDVVLCLETLEHLLDINKGICELLRVSTKYLILSIPNYLNLGGFFTIVARLATKLGLKIPGFEPQIIDHIFFAPLVLRLLRRIGLSISRITGANFRYAFPIITKPLPKLESLGTETPLFNLMGSHTILTASKKLRRGNKQ